MKKSNKTNCEFDFSSSVWSWLVLNQFQVIISLLYPLKMSGKAWFSDPFRGEWKYEMEMEQCFEIC